MTREAGAEGNLVLGQIACLLEAIGAEYFITGSHASSLRGRFRTTNDIDIVAVLDEKQAAALAEQAKTNFFADEIAISNAVREGRSFNLIHRETVLKVDIFTRIDDLAKEQLSRAIEISLPGVSAKIRFATAEDIILSKLIWYRKGNEQSEQQWRDLRGVMEISGQDLDLAYLERWAEKRNVLDLLNRLRNER